MRSAAAILAYLALAGSSFASPIEGSERGLGCPVNKAADAAKLINLLRLQPICSTALAQLVPTVTTTITTPGPAATATTTSTSTLTVPVTVTSSQTDVVNESATVTVTVGTLTLTQPATVTNTITNTETEIDTAYSTTTQEVIETSFTLATTVTTTTTTVTAPVPTATNTQYNNVFVPNSFYAAAARRGLIEGRDIAMHEVSTILELPTIVGNNTSGARGLEARGPAFKCPPGLAVISACANTIIRDACQIALGQPSGQATYTVSRTVQGGPISTATNTVTATATTTSTATATALFTTTNTVTSTSEVQAIEDVTVTQTATQTVDETATITDTVTVTEPSFTTTVITETSTETSTETQTNTPPATTTTVTATQTYTQALAPTSNRFYNGQAYGDALAAYSFGNANNYEGLTRQCAADCSPGTNCRAFQIINYSGMTICQEYIRPFNPDYLPSQAYDVQYVAVWDKA